MSDTYSIIYSSEAKDDLREIYSYIAYDLQAPETAEGQVNRIRKEIRSLDFMPSRYYVVNNGSRTITVIRIFYGGRDIEDIIQAKRE